MRRLLLGLGLVAAVGVGGYFASSARANRQLTPPSPVEEACKPAGSPCKDSTECCGVCVHKPDGTAVCEGG